MKKYLRLHKENTHGQRAHHKPQKSEEIFPQLTVLLGFSLDDILGIIFCSYKSIIDITCYFTDNLAI